MPFTIDVKMPGSRLEHYDNHIRRTLKSMQGYFNDQDAYRKMCDSGDYVLYEMFEIIRPHVAGELLSGISIIHPGKVGNEYFMTKGHFHNVLETAEIYYILSGKGYMIMENPEGEWAVEELCPGRILYVPPRWAHRSVNSGIDDLEMFFIYPGHAGHDYKSIERLGFRKLVIELNGEPTIVDNPRRLEGE